MSQFEEMFRLTMAMRNAYDIRAAEVIGLRDASDKQIAQLQADHRKMAAAQRKELNQFAETLQRTVAGLIHDLNVERATLNADQRRRLDTFTADLRHEVSDFLHERAAERRATDASQRQRLDDFMRTLRERSASFLADVRAARMLVRADQRNAQQAWQKFNTEMRQRRTGWSQPVESQE